MQYTVDVKKLFPGCSVRTEDQEMTNINSLSFHFHLRIYNHIVPINCLFKFHYIQIFLEKNVVLYQIQMLYQ